MGLDTIQDHANHALQFSIFGFGTLHEPAEHILILTGQQTAVQIAVHVIQMWVDLTDKRHQQHVQFKHAAAAVPVKAVEFNVFDHGALLKVGGKYTAVSRAREYRNGRSSFHVPVCITSTRHYDVPPGLFSQSAMTMAHTAFFCTLTHEGVLAVRGVDASKFLQGQLTCNLNYLNEDKSSLGARCTQKGRMQSSFRIVFEGDGCLLAMAGELIEAQLLDLRKYAVFSKSKLTDESADWVRFGLQDGDAALVSLGLDLPQETDSVVRANDLIAIRVSPGRAELWVRSAQADSIKSRLAAQLSEGPLNDWLLGQIRVGIGQVFGSTREEFIPQMINLQAVGGVSFKKGCYTGQEIVARMQYLGKLKRRLYRLTLSDEEIPQPGTALFSPVHASAVGNVVMAAQDGQNIELLAVLQGDAAEDGRINLGSPEGAALQMSELPYTLDSKLETQR
ncbi:Glycine cleavage T protein [Pseudomonas syringae]|nr:Glycine cleavage T protein [Pseudomonas syringae pv. aptata]RMO43143.1 Glycine cleavage T protein [Pseudomonas syringae]